MRGHALVHGPHSWGHGAGWWHPDLVAATIGAGLAADYLVWNGYGWAPLGYASPYWW